MQQTKKAKRQRRVSQESRKTAGAKNNRARKDGGRQAGSDHAAGRGIKFHDLGKHLSPVTRFEIIMSGGYSEDRNLLSMIDTEEKQLQCIEDLYRIVKAQPKYKSLKEPKWNSDTSPVAIIKYLLRKLSPLAAGNYWTVDTWYKGKKARYRFVVYKYYRRQYVKDREEYLPLDFLPFLKKRDETLHNLFIDVVALVSKCNKIPLWNEDGDFSDQLEQLWTEPEKSGNKVYDRQRYSYCFGPAREYLTLLKRRRLVVTPQSIAAQLRRYNATSDRKKAIVWWIRKGLHLAHSGQQIKEFSFIPNYFGGNPVTPFRLYKFVWSVHESDVLFVRAKSKINKSEKEGSFLPVMHSAAKPGRVLNPPMFDPFPCDLYSWMSNGVAHLLWRHKEYYYKSQFEDLMTPAEILLEQIEQIEIRNEV